LALANPRLKLGAFYMRTPSLVTVMS